MEPPSHSIVLACSPCPLALTGFCGLCPALADRGEKTRAVRMLRSKHMAERDGVERGACICVEMLVNVGQVNLAEGVKE